MDMWWLQTLAEKLAEGLPIQHGVTVSNVAWGKDGVRLQCADGQSIEADAVIVTVSLGVLKVHRRQYTSVRHTLKEHIHIFHMC